MSSWGLWGLHTAAWSDDEDDDDRRPWERSEWSGSNYLSDEDIEELKSYEKEFHDNRYLDRSEFGQLQNKLYDEFSDWAGSQKNLRVNNFHPTEPVTSWLNVEDFLKERYPHAATGAIGGIEEAGKSLDHIIDKGQPLWSGGNATTAAMLALHNKMQGRYHANEDDERRYYQLMLKHVGPDAVKRPTASTDGIRYAHIVDADVAEDLRRLAMAWDEWADKIVHTLPEKDGTLLGNQGSYEVTHENEEDVSGLLYSLNAEGPEDNSIFIDSLYTHPKFRDQGLAEALMRRLHQEYPDRRINPGYMTGDGQAFHDRMIEKEPSAKDLVTAANRILVAMAWQDWAPHIEKECRDCEWDFEGRKTHQHLEPDWNYSGGNPMRYVIEHPTRYPGRSTLDYGHYLDDDDKPFLGIHMIETDPEFQHDGVAESLMRKLHEDYPGVPIDPGGMTDEGKGFKEKLENKIPEAKSVLRQRPSYAARIAMAWEDYKDKIQGGCRACYDGWEGRYTIPQAGAFLNYTHGTHNGNPSVKVDGIYTHPSDRGKGVMEALIRRLVEDHPGTHISPGMMTTDGQKFHDRMLEKDPGAKDIVTAANWVLQTTKGIR